MQYIVNSGTTVDGDVSAFDNITATAGKWFITDASGVNDIIEFTATAGTYNVKEGYVVTATDANGNVIPSKDGILTLSEPGNYTIETISNYTNDGETITVNVDCEIDLEGMEYTKKDDMLFVGWKKDGEFVSSKQDYNKGDILVASYVEFGKNDFAIEDIHIRTEGDLGIRFVISQNLEAKNRIPVIKELGAIAFPDTTGATPASVVINKVLEETDTAVKYSFCITGIEESKYNVLYTARGYIKYIDNNNIEHIIYTDDAQNSVYKLADKAVDEGATDKIYKDIIEAVNN